MLLALLAQAAVAHNPDAVSHPRIVGGAIFHADDYPLEARRHLWSGTVIADLTINARGTVDDCKIVESSGHELLDDMTCTILIKGARFKPARDKDGNAVPDTIRTPEIGWAAVP
jgi:TonB family protein